ncbi:UNVERIFIED_ORG: hypothetical protein LHJ69_16030 [Shinella sp. XGS7]|nr:hypothetical protein [Shinella sp. XGS7]
MSQPKRTFVALAIAGVSVGSSAATTTDECLKFQKADERLACFDKALGFKPEPATPAQDTSSPPSLNQQKVAPKSSGDSDLKLVTWKLRDSGTVSPTGYADIGTKPAVFQVGRDDGKDFTKVKASAVGVMAALNLPGNPFNGWERFFGVSWNRDTSAKTPKDERQLFLGISGMLLRPSPTGTGLFPTFRLGYKDDTKAHTHEGWTNAHFDVIHLPWVANFEMPEKNSWAPVPYFGLFSSNPKSSPSAASDGSYYGFYVGLKNEFKLWAIADRLSLAVTGQAYRDAHAPSTVGKRTLRFGSVGFKYDLADPEKKGGWVPSLSLAWQRGTDPVTGEGPGEKTLLGLTVKYN